MSNSLSSLRSRLILLLFTAMIPALALMLDSAAKYRDLTATQTKQNVLMAARAIASEQDRALDNAHEFLVTISRVPQIHEMNRAACSKILAGLLEPRYADLVVTDRSGNRVCTALARDNSLASSVSRDHSRSIEARDFTVGTIRRHASKKTLLDVTYPLLDGPGMIRGAVSAVLDLSWMSRMTADTHLYPGATFTLLGSNGDILLRYPNEQEWIGKTIIADGSPLRLFSSENGTVEAVGPDGTRRLFGISRLKNSVGGETTYAAVDLPVDIAFARTREILVHQLIALAILSAIILGSTWFGTDILVLRRIRDIIAATKKIAAGDLRARTILVHDNTELGQMAQAFNHLAESLERREAEAVDSSRQIHQQRQQQEALYDLNRGITSTLDVESVLRILLDHIALLFSSFTVTVSWINPQTRTLETIASREGTGSELSDRDLLGADSLPLLVLQRQTLLSIADGRMDAGAADPDIFLRHGWVSYLGLPLMVKNEALGVLSFYRRNRHEFTRDETTFLSALVNEAAVAIHNSQLFEQTRQQALELEKSNKIKDEFLGVMSHELRTPLNIIMNYSEALRMGTFGEISPDQARGTDKIRQQASHLLSLINGILEITKIESGTVSVEAHSVDLKSFLAELKSDYMLPLENGVALVWAETGELPSMITDQLKLKQIVTNLINNAIKFTEEGSVTVSAGIAPDKSRVEIHVSDTGPGMPVELLPFIFDKFRQIDSATTRNYSGAGLGLYIVKNFVSILGGTIDVHSKVGEGSVFTISFPVALDSREAEKAPALPNTAELRTLA